MHAGHAVPPCHPLEALSSDLREFDTKYHRIGDACTALPSYNVLIKLDIVVKFSLDRHLGRRS